MKKKYITVLMGFTLILSACSKFGDTNVSPNAATAPVTPALLTYVQTFLGSDAVGATTTTNAGALGSPNLYTGYLVQHYSDLQYPQNSLYITSGINWDNYYVALLEDLYSIIKQNTEKPSPTAVGGNSVNQIQIARILKAYFYSILTDKYGDVPYFDALKSNLKVKYDKQQDIYNDLFKELKEASAAFQNSGNAITGDIVYSGNISKWKKFANSLRLSLALRLSKVDPAKGKAEFSSALTDAAGVIETNADGFTVKYPGGTYNHPLFNLTLASYFAISQPLADLMNTYSDPRIVKYGETNSTGGVKGVPYGLNKANASAWLTANPNYSKAYAATLKVNNASAYVFSAAYVNLMRAEAAITYNTGENAFDFYKKGVLESWSQWGVTGDINAYLTSVGVSASNIPVAKIQEQIWISLFGSEMNAWNEQRRSGVPALTVAPDASNSPKAIPRRYMYPSTEVNLNADAYNAAVSAMPYGGKDNETSRVWWDKP